MERHGIQGRLKFMGEPAEKVCGSKPVHAAKGYYDDMDAAVSIFTPPTGTLRTNTCILDTHCGSYWSRIYSFICDLPGDVEERRRPRSVVRPHRRRAPGANDALCLMYTTTKYTKESMLPHTGTWTLNEALLATGNATSRQPGAAVQPDPVFLEVRRRWRCSGASPHVLDRNAEHVAAVTHCRLESHWVTRTRVGLPNHAMARIAYANLELVGGPQWDDEARSFCRELQKNLGIEPMEEPILAEMTDLCPPEECEAQLRATAAVAAQLHVRRLCSTGHGIRPRCASSSAAAP